MVERIVVDAQSLGPLRLAWIASRQDVGRCRTRHALPINRASSRVRVDTIEPVITLLVLHRPNRMIDDVLDSELISQHLHLLERGNETAAVVVVSGDACEAIWRRSGIFCPITDVISGSLQPDLLAHRSTAHGWDVNRRSIVQLVALVDALKEHLVAPTHFGNDLAECLLDFTPTSLLDREVGVMVGEP